MIDLRDIGGASNLVVELFPDLTKRQVEIALRAMTHIYWVVQQPAVLICAVRWSASLNRHKTWPGGKNGHVKGACSGLKALCQRMGRNAQCRGM
jgi:hypothetical protein